MALAASLKSVQKLSTSHPYLFGLVKDLPVPHSVESIAASFKDTPKVYNAFMELRGTVDQFKKVEFPETYKIDWNFYRQHYPNPKFIEAFHTAYTAPETAKDKEIFQKAEEATENNAELEKFFADFERDLKQLDQACKAASATATSIQAELAKLEATSQAYEDMTIQDVADAFPELAEEAEQEIVNGAWGLEKSVEEDSHGSHH